MNSKSFSQLLSIMLASVLCFAGWGISADIVTKDGSPADYTVVPDLKTIQNQLQQDRKLASQGELDPTTILKDNVHGAQVQGTPILEQAKPGRHPIRLPRPIKRRPTTIHSCEEITSPGSYVLGNDIFSSSPMNCLNIHDTKNVSIDCAGHQIIGDFGYPAAVVTNVNGISLNHCDFERKDVAAPNLIVIGVTNGRFDHDRITGDYYQRDSSFVTISNNVFTANASGIDAAEIVVHHGSHNTLINNQIDGLWDGTEASYDKQGADDGILLSDESFDTITGNDIQNTWDAGIEGSGRWQNNLIANNHIQHIRGCAIGSWWDTNWDGNTIQNNRAQDVETLFTFAYSQTPNVPTPAVIDFKNDLFTGNSVGKTRAPLPGVGPQSSFIFSVAAPPQTIVQNNILKDNNFGPIGPVVFPPAGFIDGGGNQCQAPAQGPGITCQP